MIWSGKQAQGRGESVAKANLDWHDRYNEANKKTEWAQIFFFLIVGDNNKCRFARPWKPILNFCQNDEIFNLLRRRHK